MLGQLPGELSDPIFVLRVSTYTGVRTVVRIASLSSRARLLGWAGVQLRDGDASIVIDPLRDAGAMWAPAGAAARDVRLPDGAPIATAFLPVNAARVQFPHRQPSIPRRAVMDARDAAAAAAALGATSLVPIHYGAYDLPPIYVSDPDPIPALRSAARAASVEVRLPELGSWFDIATEAAL